ncbi:MAG TPA: 50S ribosomal protein L15 [Anaerolineales bacterium]|nr:50S ribosomal protein L15 [Anaerolineales bacterium]
MKLHDLAPTDGAKKKRKRVGRGIAAGQGKTAGRGTKGEGARKAKGGSLYRQGGNLPFFRSLPFKRGFTNIRRVEYAEVNLDRLAEFPAGAELNPASLAQAGLIRDEGQRVVLLGRGRVKQALTLKVHRASKSAVAKVEAAGGKVEIIA